jgi:hypothetical protein
MTMYEVEFAYNVPEWSTVELDAATKEDAELEADTIIKDLYPEAINIEILGVKEIKNG